MTSKRLTKKIINKNPLKKRNLIISQIWWLVSCKSTQRDIIGQLFKVVHFIYKTANGQMITPLYEVFLQYYKIYEKSSFVLALHA